MSAKKTHGHYPAIPAALDVVTKGLQTSIQGSLDLVRLCLSEFERLKGGNAFLASSQVTLADCFLAPVFAYLTMTPDAEGLLSPHQGLRSWWAAMSERPSVQKTPPQFG